MRVAILTPDPADPAHAGRWSEVRDRMVGPLAAEGVTVESFSWIGDPLALKGFDLVLPLTTWGYHRAYDQWRAMCDAWEFEGVRIQNPASVLRWNADKRYLARLYDAEAPVIPTMYVDRFEPQHLHEAAVRFGVDRLIVKPQVSASAYQTLLVNTGDVVEGAPQGPAMIQPYMDAVEGDGELSLIFFGGEFSHAIRKVARTGDFRVQPEYGGHISAYEPDADVLGAARRVLKEVEEPLLYARVDLVRDPWGNPQLMELELIEPDLYLGFDPERGAGFARAVRRAAETFAAAASA
ncbi:MAG TPA: transporter [Caulobacteraceae bacterium]|nr:transporter [Caulobacteraceae bacterium]